MIALALGLLLGLTESVTTTLDVIDELDRGIASSQNTLASLGNEAETLTGRVALADAELANARMRYDAAYEVYRERVRAVARIPAGTLLVLLGESTSFADVLRTAKMLRRIAMHDHEAQQILARETKALRDAEESAAADRAALERLTARVRETRDALADKRRDRLETLQIALANDDARAGVQREMAKSHKQLAGMLSRTETDSPIGHFSTLRGKLPWPVVGKLAGGFDDHGVTINAVVGDPVQAVASGRVAFVGWVRGYGQTVLIDHGEHYHTVLAQLSEVVVHERDIVSPGTLIGRVGESGPTRHAALRFELHKSGVATDPMRWLRK